MWVDRNAVFYSEDNSRLSRNKREIDISIAEQYSMGLADLPTHIKAMLREPRANVLRRPLEERINWLRQVSLERSRARRSLVRQRTMMYELTSVSRHRRRS